MCSKIEHNIIRCALLGILLKVYCYQEELLTVNFHCLKFSYIKISVVGDRDINKSCNS